MKKFAVVALGSPWALKASAQLSNYSAPAMTVADCRPGTTWQMGSNFGDVGPNTCGSICYGSAGDERSVCSDATSFFLR